MLRLNTFGGLVLQQDGQLHTGAAAQRRRLALLAVVGRRVTSRDKLLALLWPDTEPEAGRHSLHQALHAIRRSVGSDEVFQGSSTLQLNPDLITSDVGEFEEAIDHGAHEAAGGRSRWGASPRLSDMTRAPGCATSTWATTTFRSACTPKPVTTSSGP